MKTNKKSLLIGAFGILIAGGIFAQNDISQFLFANTFLSPSASEVVEVKSVGQIDTSLIEDTMEMEGEGTADKMLSSSGTEGTMHMYDQKEIMHPAYENNAEEMLKYEDSSETAPVYDGKAEEMEIFPVDEDKMETDTGNEVISQPETQSERYERIGHELEKRKHRLEEIFYKELEFNDVEKEKLSKAEVILQKLEELYREIGDLFKTEQYAEANKLLDWEFEALWIELEKCLHELQYFHKTYFINDLKTSDQLGIEKFIEEDYRGNRTTTVKSIVEKAEPEAAYEVMYQISIMEPEVVDTFMDEVAIEHEEIATDTMESIGYMSVEHQEDILQEKADIFKELKELQRLREKLYQEKTRLVSEFRKLEEIQETIAKYNFIGISGDNIQRKVHEFVATADTLSETEIGSLVSQLEQETHEVISNAREEKFQKGVIPFRDTDDNDWFTADVADIKIEGIVEGKRDADGNLLGKYAPAETVTIGEILKIAFKAAGVEPTYIPQTGEHWATGYQRKAREYGIEFDSNLLDKPAFRSTVAMILFKIGGTEIVQANQSSCPDVSTSHPRFEYMQTAYQLKLIQGDGKTGRCRPDEGINRAETAKLVNQFSQMEELVE